MTDNEIIKNLEKVANADCNRCSFNNENCDGEDCDKYIAQKILDLINRPKADIESLQKIKENSLKIISMGEKQILEIREKSLKEFAEKLKNGVDSLPYKWVGISETVLHTIIDTLVKEMVGEG